MMMQGGGGVEGIKTRFMQYVAQIPGQTLALFVSVIILSLLNILTFDLVSIALSLNRSKPAAMEFSDPSTVVLLVLSPFSSTHGLFSTLLAVYLGNYILSHHEARLQQRLAWAYFPSLLLAQLAINLLALQVDSLWKYTFPLGQAQFAMQAWGGLFPLICFLESMYGMMMGEGGDTSKEVQLPLPFSFTKRSRGFALAVIASLVKAGDVDVFCAALLGYCIGFVLQMRCNLLNPGYAPLPTNSNDAATTETRDPENEADRRALFLAATERRLNKI